MTNLVLKLADAVGSSLGVTKVYGDPVDVDGVTVLPVALLQFGFGAGSDEGDPDSSAGGGGGGGTSIPIGAYVREGDTVTFRPNPVTLLCVGIPFVWVAGHALARVIKALKK